jgi:hypothetical protein
MSTGLCSHPIRLINRHEFARMPHAESETSYYTCSPSHDQIPISGSIWSRVPSSLHQSTGLIAYCSDRAHGWYVVRTTCTISGYNYEVGSTHVNSTRRIISGFLALPS